MTTGPRLDELLPIALDMTASLSSADRAQRIVDAARRALRCDAVALLRAQGEELVPVATRGLAADVLGRRFPLADHPRLAEVSRSEEPVRFAADSVLPDPYDGAIVGRRGPPATVHSCLGFPLRIDGKLIGVLTADDLRPGAFDDVDPALLAHLSALTGAALRTADLIDALEQRAAHEGLVASDLIREVRERRGGLLLGSSPAMARLQEEIDTFATAGLPVLVTGETGVGKELVVRTLHARSARANRPLVYLNCAALPESIAESELFGHERGAFTGADRARPGKFAIADGGSLFLDEIGELPLHLQAKLLRALQQGEVQRLGSDETIKVDVRVLAASNRDLDAEVAAGRFRADLLHRLDVCRIRVPPLREHPQDVPLLAGHFADRARRRLGTGPIRFSEAALAALQRGQWPGNVRELENVVSRAILRALHRAERGAPVLIDEAHLDLPVGGGDESEVAPNSPTEPAGSMPPTQHDGERRPLRAAVDEFQRALVREAVERHEGNWAAAARYLDMDRANLYHMARRLGLK
jgi:anaerobic nitric oxide reductase transcription regulator